MLVFSIPKINHNIEKSDVSKNVQSLVLPESQVILILTVHVCPSNI